MEKSSFLIVETNCSYAKVKSGFLNNIQILKPVMITAFLFLTKNFGFIA